MKSMKKNYLLFLVLSVVLVSACGEITTSTSTTSTSTTSTTVSTTTEITGGNTVIYSPDPSEDTRPASTNNQNVIVVDNSNKEAQFADAYLVEDENADNGSYLLAANENFVVSYEPIIKVSGYYKIYVSFPEFENASSKVGIDVGYNGGKNYDSTKTLNMSINQGDYVYVGSYFLKAGNSNVVMVGGAYDGKEVAVDSMLFEIQYVTETMTYDEKLKARDQVENPAHQFNIIKSKATNSYKLTKDGEEIFLKGICGIDELELMAQAGANAVRIYAECTITKELLDRAYELGVHVMMGFGMLKETDDFTYATNDQQVQEQYDAFVKFVEQYKDHPAVFCWAIGNEVDKLTSKDMPAIYEAMNDLARYCHEADPYHPTVAVLAGCSTKKITYLTYLANHIDIVCYNAYKHVGNAKENTKIFKGPYMITEYALDQPSETSTKTSWGAVIEPNNQQKAEKYVIRYKNEMLNLSDKNCVGSFAFKDTGGFRVTHTWYGLILEGYKTLQYVRLSEAFKGTTDKLIIPYLSNLYLNGKKANDSVKVAVGSQVTLDLEFTRYNGESLKYKIELKKEAPISSNSVPKVIETEYTKIKDNQYKFNVPTAADQYRVFVYVYIDDEYITNMNFPFLVE